MTTPADKTPQPAETDLRKIAMAIRYDATAIQAKVTELVRQIDQLHLEPTPRHDCPRCGLPQTGPMRLAEHIHQMHEGPVPEHWLSIEHASAEPDEPVLE